MIQKIIKTVITYGLLVAVLYVGGYTINEFSHTAQIKAPADIFSPLVETLPEVDVSNVDLPEYETGDLPTEIEKNPIVLPTTNSQLDPMATSDIPKADINLEDEDIPTSIPKASIEIPKYDNKEIESKRIALSYQRTIKVTIDGKTIELSSDTTVSFVKWLGKQYKADSTVVCKETTPVEVLNELSELDTMIVSASPSPSVIDIPNSSPEINNEDNNKLEYDDILKDEEELDTIIDDIDTVKELKEIDGYNREDYEKPVISYTLNNKKINRNDYSWKTSDFLVSIKPFEYVCPYSGEVVTDESKLDYDHIVALKSTYIRGADDWTNKQKNEYAYDPYIGIDVYYSANRSKGDRGPSEWLPEENTEDYCYSWLVICSKYDLTMTNEEIEICDDIIQTAIDNGETVERIGGDSITH